MAILILLGLHFFLGVEAQSNFTLPENIQLHTKEDYARYENTVKESAIWLEKADLDKEREKRTEVNNFIVKWTTGSPQVSILINPELVKLTERNPDLLIIYMANFSKCILENKAEPNTLKASKEGIISIMNVYKRGLSVKKNKVMENLIKLSPTDWDAYMVEHFNR